MLHFVPLKVIAIIQWKANTLCLVFLTSLSWLNFKYFLNCMCGDCRVRTEWPGGGKSRFYNCVKWLRLPCTCHCWDYTVYKKKTSITLNQNMSTLTLSTKPQHFHPFEFLVVGSLLTCDWCAVTLLMNDQSLLVLIPLLPERNGVGIQQPTLLD